MCTNSKGDPLSANCTKRNHVTIMADKRIVMGEGGQILGNEGMRGELQVYYGLARSMALCQVGDDSYHGPQKAIACTMVSL